MAYKAKIQSWLPRHFTGENYDPYITALGTFFDSLIVFAKQLQKQTFISQSNTEYLELHAKERSITRVQTGNFRENDGFLKDRVRRIKYNQTEQNIINNIRSLAFINSVIKPDFPDGVFSGAKDKTGESWDSEYPSAEWGNFGPLDMNKRHKCFLIAVETTLRPPFGFYDDDRFYDDADGDAFFDQRERIFDENLAIIIKRLIKQKISAGAGFRLVIKGFRGLAIGGKSQQEADLNSL